MELGVDTWEHAFVRIPSGNRALAQQPGAKDGMHVWLEGISKSQLAYTMYMMVRKFNWCTKDELKARAKAFGWPTDKLVSRPGFIPRKVFAGTAAGRGGRGAAAAARGRARAPTVQSAARVRARAPTVLPAAGGGRRRPTATATATTDAATDAAAAAAAAALSLLPTPHSTVTMPYTAHHMLVFVLNSIELFRPLLPPNAMDHPFWNSWVLHVHIIASMMKPEFTHPELVQLDNLVFDWHTKFFEVPEYKTFWVPKFHYASHLAMDIKRFGPTRLNWCMMYEAKNQPLKKGCKLSNFHNPVFSTAKYWCESSDHLMRKPKQKPPKKKPSSSGVAADFPYFADEIAFMLQKVEHAEKDADVRFDFLDSTKKCTVVFYKSSYALLKTPEMPTALCYIDKIVAIGGHTYVWVVVYPQGLMYHDQYGVLTASLSEMHNSRDTEIQFLSMATAQLSAMWHFRQPSGTLTFVSKW
jgi:hypothetical protein